MLEILFFQHTFQYECITPLGDIFIKKANRKVAELAPIHPRLSPDPIKIPDELSKATKVGPSYNSGTTLHFQISRSNLPILPPNPHPGNRGIRVTSRSHPISRTPRVELIARVIAVPALPSGVRLGRKTFSKIQPLCVDTSPLRD